jgi:hypothetical protein
VVPVMATKVFKASRFGTRKEPPQKTKMQQLDGKYHRLKLRQFQNSLEYDPPEATEFNDQHLLLE